MLNNIIVTVLTDRGKVTLPTIGIFVRVEIEGQIEYLFTPTATKIDSVMIDVVMTEMEMDRVDAENLIINYIELIKTTIKKSGNYTLKDVGQIMCDTNGVYYFGNIEDEVKKSIIKEGEVSQNILAEREREQVVFEYGIEQGDEEEKDAREVDIEEINIAKKEIEEYITEEYIEETNITKEEIKEENIAEDDIEEINIEEEEIEEEEIKEEEINEKILVEFQEPAIVEVKSKSNRLNERFKPKTLGEIMEGRANKRFHDKIYSQVVDKEGEKLEIIKESIAQENSAVYDYNEKEPRRVTDIEREMLKSNSNKQKQRKGIYDLYDRTKMEKEINKYQRSSGLNSYRNSDKDINEVNNNYRSRKKIDFVLIISIIVIVLGLATIIYLYAKQKELGL